MAKLVASIFNEYLSVLFEDFSSKNVNSKLFTGKIDIQNVNVRKDLLKEILAPVFPNIEIVQALCDSVSIHIPTLHLKSQPVEVKISALHIVLREPVEFTAVSTNLLSKFDKSAGGKAKEAGQSPPTVSWNAGLAIAFGATVNIDLIDIRLEPLLGADGLRPPMLRLELMNLKVYSTDDKWRRVPLNKSWELSQSSKDVVQVFKEVKIDSISVSFESEEHSSAILTLPLLVRFHLSLARSGLVPRSIFVEAAIDTCSIKLGSDEVRHLFIFLLSLERCLQRTNKPEKKGEPESESSEFMSFSRMRSHSAAEQISDITGRFAKANIAEELSLELSSSEVSEGIGADEDASSTLEGDAGEEVNSSGTLVPTFKLRFSAGEIRVNLLLGNGDIYIVKISDIGVGHQLLVCVESGPVDDGSDAVLLSTADSVVVGTTLHAQIAPIVMERLSRSSKDQLLPVMSIFSDDFSMSFLHPRPPPPQKGFSVRWNLAQISIAIPLDDCARLYGMIMSDDVLSWISRDPGIFSRLVLSGTPPPPDPFDISACEFDAHLSLKTLHLAVPLVSSNLWFERFRDDKHLQYALRIHIADVILTSGSCSVENQQQQLQENVEPVNIGRHSRSGRSAHLNIKSQAVHINLGSTSIHRLVFKSHEVGSRIADIIPPDSALFVHLPSVSVELQFPLMPIASSIQNQAHSHVQSLIKLVHIKKAFFQTGHIKNRSIILKSHSNCFPASVLIDWMCESGHESSRDEAVAIGRQFLERRFIRCVGGSSEEFCDDDSLYRFYSDESQIFRDRHVWVRILAAQEQKILQAKDSLPDGLTRDFAAQRHIHSGSAPFVLHLVCPGTASIVLNCSNTLHIVSAMLPLLDLFSLHAGLAHIGMLGLVDISNRRCMFVHPNFSTCLIAPTHLAVSALLQAIHVRVIMNASSDTVISAAKNDELHLDINIGSTSMTGDAPPDLMMLRMRRLWEDSNGIKPQPIPQLDLKISIDSIGVSVLIPNVASCPVPIIFQPQVDGHHQIVIDVSMSVDGADSSVNMRAFLDGLAKVNKRLSLGSDSTKDDGSSAVGQKPNVVLIRSKVEGLCACLSVDVLKHLVKGVIATVSCLDQNTLLKLADVFGSVSASGVILSSNAYLISARMCLQNLISAEFDSSLANDVSIDILQLWQRELKHNDEVQVRSVNDHFLRALWCFGLDFYGSSFSAQLRTSQLSPNCLNVKVDFITAKAAFIQQIRSKMDPLPGFSVLELSAPSIEPLMRQIVEKFIVLGAQVLATLGTCSVTCAIVGDEAPVPSLRLSEIRFEASAFLNTLHIGSMLSQDMFWNDMVARIDFTGKDSDGSVNFLITTAFVQELLHAISSVAASAADVSSLFEQMFPSSFLSLIASAFARRSIAGDITGPAFCRSDRVSPDVVDHSNHHSVFPNALGAAIHPSLLAPSRTLLAVQKLDSSLGLLQRIAESSLGQSIAPFLASNAASKLPLPKPLPSWAAGLTAKSSDTMTTGFPWSHSFSETSVIEGGVRFCRSDRETAKKGPSSFFSRAPRVDWHSKWAIVRSSGALLLFEDSNSSSPPSVRVDMTFAQYSLVSSDFSKHPSLWTQSSAGDSIFIRPPVGADLFLTITDDSSLGHAAGKWLEAFRECALAVRVQKSIVDEGAASLARIRAFRDDEVGGSSSSSAHPASSVSVLDAVPVLVDIITYARDEAISAHHDLSSARVELEVTKRALASSAQDLQTLRGLLEQRDDELRASKQALNDAVRLKQSAVSDANRVANQPASVTVSSGSRLLLSSCSSLTLPPRAAAVVKAPVDDVSDDDEISISSSPFVAFSSSDLLAAGRFSALPAQAVQDETLLKAAFERRRGSIISRYWQASWLILDKHGMLSISQTENPSEAKKGQVERIKLTNYSFILPAKKIDKHPWYFLLQRKSGVKPDSSGMDARKTYAPMQHAFLLSAVPQLILLRRFSHEIRFPHEILAVITSVRCRSRYLMNGRIASPSGMVWLRSQISCERQPLIIRARTVIHTQLRSDDNDSDN